MRIQLDQKSERRPPKRAQPVPQWMKRVKIRMILIKTLHPASLIVTQSIKVSSLKCFSTHIKKSNSQAKRRKAKKKAKKAAKKSAIVDSYLDPKVVDKGAPQGTFVTPHDFIKKRAKRSKDKAEETFINADNTILVTSMSTTGSSMKEGYNMLPDANETINVTNSSDAQMEESKLLNEGGDDVPDNSIYDDPIFTDPSQRLTLLKYRNSNLPNINLNLGKKRLSILKTSAIHKKITVQLVMIKS